MLKKTAGLSIVGDGVETEQVIRGQLAPDVGC